MAMLEAGYIVCGRYRILEKLGQGGTGLVFLSEDLQTGGRVAIKEVRCTEGIGGKAALTSFRSEIEMLQKLRHAGLPRIETILSFQDCDLLVMEHIPGSSLQEILSEFGAQPLASVYDWMIQLCGILTYLHTRTPPVIYRDIKPANIMRKPDGQIMLIDFGAARELRPGEGEDTMLLGTRGYAAPEQYGGIGQSDRRTDIYGLGATIYHLVTGHDPRRPPYLRHPITYWNSGLQPKLSKLIQKCLMTEPNSRYANCSEIADELLHLQGSLMYREERGYTEVIGHTGVKYRFETDITVVYTGDVLQ